MTTKARNHHGQHPIEPAIEYPWPIIFRHGVPIPSDSSPDSVIKVFDGTGQLKEYIDPTTRRAIDATTFEPRTTRREAQRKPPEDQVEAVEEFAEPSVEDLLEV